ncbi:MAG: helix-turn-helix domain-containing protein [Clostridiales bacterium]|nr:helix-turn-helix domain-containing protein [Clostridiales bacterium]MDD6935864.1 helix-turn-helix transcriptional regulator [Clostridiales bacterium]MDY2961617.1 helix-turn-helix transcriptional regulator [Oscillospiraceae bacterium]
MGERIKQLRQALGMTQQEFADHLHIKRGAVANYEVGRNASDTVIAMICREYNVSETWLRTGEGDMFLQRSTEDEIAAFMGDVLKDEPDNFRRQFIAALARMDDSGWAVLEKFINDFNDKKREAQD